MANWNFCCYKCVGDSKEIEELYSIIKKCDNERENKNFYDYDEVIESIGLSPKDFESCGEISDYEMEDGVLEIYHRARYGAHYGFKDAIEKRFPSIKVYYRYYEYMMEFYRTNSLTYFPIRYIRWDSEYGSDGWTNLAEAATACEDIVGYKVEPTVDAISKAYAEHNKREGTELLYTFKEIIEEDD